MAEQHRLFAKHPKTQFIDAHLGWLGGDLGAAGQAASTSCRTSTPRSAPCWPSSAASPAPRASGSSSTRTASCSAKTPGRADEYLVYFRVLETDDEYFDYYRKRHAFWKMYGLGLPDEVLKKLYYKNALKVIPGIDASAFPP